jgi:hypothetical protein
VQGKEHEKPEHDRAPHMSDVWTSDFTGDELYTYVEDVRAAKFRMQVPDDAILCDLAEERIFLIEYAEAQAVLYECRADPAQYLARFSKARSNVSVRMKRNLYAEGVRMMNELKPAFTNAPPLPPSEATHEACHNPAKERLH